jgi:pyochelin biosynthetic protein PchC
VSVLVRHRGPARPRTRLVCFPHAGAPPGFFTAWGAGLPAHTEVLTARYPGSPAEGAALGDVAALAAAALDALAPRPTHLFGHSMGALVAYETARRLRRPPARLYVSACDAPPVGRAPVDVSGDDALLGELRRIGGTDPGLLGDEAALTALLPRVRHHFELLNGYAFTAGPPLTCPVTAFHAHQDTEATADAVGRWREVTAAGFDLRGFPGDHFYLVAQRDQLLAEIGTRLDAPAADWQLAP